MYMLGTIVHTDKMFAKYKALSTSHIIMSTEIRMCHLF